MLLLFDKSVVNTVVVYSYYFIVRFTTFLNAAGLLYSFSVPAISWVESIGNGQWRGKLAGGGEPKVNHSDSNCSVLPLVCDMN